MPRLVTKILLAAVCTSIFVEASANQAGDECNDQTSLLQLSSRAHSAPVDVKGEDGDNSTTNGRHMPGSEAGKPLLAPSCWGSGCDLIKAPEDIITRPTKDWHACGETIPVKGSTKPLPARGLITCCNGPAYMFDESNAKHLVKHYLRFGGRFIDTAPSYGVGERSVGPAIRSSGIPRDEIWLQSKLETSSFLPSKGNELDWVHYALDKILADVGVPYMDSIVLHTGPGEAEWEAKAGDHKMTPKEFVAIWRGLMDAKKKGKVHNIGVAQTTKAEIEHLIKETGEVPAIVQIWWFPWMPEDQHVFIDWLKSKEIAVQVYGMFNTMRHSPVMMMRATDAALRHGPKVTWGQLVIQMALDMGLSFVTSYHGGWWQDDLKCNGFQTEAKDREILAVTPRWTCSHGLVSGQILSGCGAPTTQEIAKESHALAKGPSRKLEGKLVKLEETQSKLKTTQKLLMKLAKKTADKEEALHKVIIEKHILKRELKKGYRRLDDEKKKAAKLSKKAFAKEEAKIAELAKETDAKAEVLETQTLLKAHLKAEVRTDHRDLINAEAKALKLSEDATVNQEAFDRDVDALGAAALTKSLRLSDMVMAQKTFAESERKFAKSVKEAEEKDKTFSRNWQDLKVSSLETDHRHLAEVAHRASVFSFEAIIVEEAYTSKETSNAIAQKELYQNYAKLTPLEKLEKDLQVAKQKEADNRKIMAEAVAKQQSIDHKAAKLQKKAGLIKTDAHQEAQKIVEQVMEKAKQKTNAFIKKAAKKVAKKAVKPETNMKESEILPAKKIKADGAASCQNGWQTGDGTGSTEENLGTAADQNTCIAMVKNQRPMANGATIHASGSGSCYAEFGMTGYDDKTIYISCLFQAKVAKELPAKADKKKQDEIERYCHKEWQPLVQLRQRDPWATICLSGDPRYTQCRQHSVHCKDYSPLHL